MTGDEPQGTMGRVQTPVVSFPPSFARIFSSRERRLGTRQAVGGFSKVSRSISGAIIGVGADPKRGFRASFRGSRVEFRETGDRFATLFECSLDFPSASYLDRQCMHSGRMSQSYINIIRNTFIAKTL